MNQRFHFTFGPVQGFVAQARRTRDLWAGSWLLSYLAEAAIAETEKAGARMILPFRDEADWGTITMTRGGTAARFGGIPNRFTAEADDPTAAARAAADGLRRAWQRIADAVWGRFVADAARERGIGTREIWERQVASYWETSWVVGDAGTLAARKNLRLVDARVEPGDHCSLISELQELSGHIRARERERQTAFWQKVRGQPGISTLDLEENERLSAIALIKRFFPHVGRGSVGADLQELRGWPSTAWLAASPWIATALQEAPEGAAEFARALDQLEWEPGYRGETKAAERRFGGSGPNGFAALDGPLYFDTALGNPASLDNLKEGQNTSREVELLQKLYKAADAKPEPFYAVLLMDGDRMGHLLGRAREADAEHGEQQVSKALGDFAGDVDGVVKQHHGYTVYAGGDDMLALLPADTALACAVEVEDAYRGAFAKLAAVAGHASISGALVFAHYREPLRGVLRYAHHLLDAVAKDRTGRGALAVGIVQPSGVGAEWAAPWEVVRGDQPKEGMPLREFAAEFGKGGRFNPTYHYNLRRTFTRLTDEKEGRLSADFGDDLLSAVAAAEHRRSRERPDDRAFDEVALSRLVALLRRWHRTENGMVDEDQQSFRFDGVRVAAFLARVGGVVATAGPDNGGR